MLSVSNSITLLTKAISKSTFQTKGSTIILLSMTTLSYILILYLEMGIYPKTREIHSERQVKRYTNRLNRRNGKVRTRGRGRKRERMESSTDHLQAVMCALLAVMFQCSLRSEDKDLLFSPSHQLLNLATCLSKCPVMMFLKRSLSLSCQSE